MALGKYFLDGLDMYEEYGFVAAPGCSDAILSSRKPKERYFNDWLDEDGSEWDLTSPTFYEDRQITLRGYIIVQQAGAESAFWGKYNALKEAFDAPGYRVLRCAELGTGNDVKVFLRDAITCKRKTRIKGSTLIATEIEIPLQEVQIEEDEEE